ncbi:MAG: SAF domain-containing protein [Acidimicrobiia bacterium]
MERSVELRPANTVQPDGGPRRLTPGLVPVRRRRQRGLAVLAVLAAVAAALIFAVWARGLGGRTDVLAAARTVDAGEVIADADLRVVRVAVDDDVATIPAEDRAEVVGKVAAITLFGGGLIQRDQVSSSVPLGRGEAIVGVLVKPGQGPLASLRVGTTVQVVETPPGSQAAPGTPPAVLAEEATVFAVAKPTEDANAAGVAGSLLVSLRVPKDVAPAVVAAAEDERVRLVLVGGVTG